MSAISPALPCQSGAVCRGRIWLPNNVACGRSVFSGGRKTKDCGPELQTPTHPRIQAKDRNSANRLYSSRPGHDNIRSRRTAAAGSDSNEPSRYAHYPARLCKRHREVVQPGPSDEVIHSVSGSVFPRCYPSRVRSSQYSHTSISPLFRNKGGR